MKHFFLALLGVAALMAAPAFGTDSTPPGRGKTPPPQGVSAQQDKEIEAAIRAKLAKSKIGQDKLTVRVQGGVAYWSGSTTVLQHKGAATRMAKGRARSWW